MENDTQTDKLAKNRKSCNGWRERHREEYNTYMREYKKKYRVMKKLEKQNQQVQVV